MKSRERLQQEIEDTRAELDHALEEGKSFDEFYEKSVQLDRLIEEYIDLAESREAFLHN